MNSILWLTLAFILFVILLVVIPINIKAKVVYDVLKNEGKIQLKLFKLTLFYVTFTIEKGFLELTTKKNKKILVPIETGTGGTNIQTDFILILLKKIRIQHGTIYVNFGAKSDAFLTAIIVGTVKVLTSSFGAILKSKKSKSKLTNKIYADFSKDKLKLCLKASIKISILQVFDAYLKSLVGKIKFNKELSQYDWKSKTPNKQNNGRSTHQN